LIEPVTIDLVTLGRGELEVEGNAMVQPDAAASVANIAGVDPGEKEPLTAAKLGVDHNLKVGQYAVVEFNYTAGIAVG
jgi:hypothetical protein